MTTLQEALPCPFCGKQQTLQVISGQELMGEDQEFWQHSDSFGVVCDASSPDGKGGCGAMGGFKPTEDEAIEAWNTRTALAQQGDPVAYSQFLTDVVTAAGLLEHGRRDKGLAQRIADYAFSARSNLYTAAPAPQAQPMTDPCKTCSHFKEGKLPGVRIHDETCYECRSYWGNKWEAA